ncbi:DUF1697 domain-containing protein [Tsuneonella sp. YG55]|uniref:DUF1697 domain-containing protein n=1 Tax=Tsuneonella litorea TaxID=2976475 RepID=A0A9X2W2T0_9SPHN|nr:DUF1697 domain-containing protein [Tsuneonella litorea]MCT2559543.1 DUF1697 domain-containing protein [Tsuneonella litorea]
MPRCAAFLGSINVGGNRLAMADLRAALVGAGFAGVETVAASGNVLLDLDDADRAGAAGEIARVVKAEFGIDSLVVVRNRASVWSAIEDNPFHGDGQDRFVHSIFLDRLPPAERFEALLAEHRSRGGERLALGPGVLYLDYVHGVGVSSLTGAFLQRRLGVRGTARNMTSLKRILAKMDF